MLPVKKPGRICSAGLNSLLEEAKVSQPEGGTSEGCDTFATLNTFNKLESG
nr:MAG TPA: hypothetical protein [Caudoviricetes sp.]